MQAEVPLELYGARTGNCLRVAIALEESGLPYEARRVELRAGAHRAPDFLRLNPAGKVPVLIDRRSAEEIVIAQSNAIMLHLAEAAPEQLIPTSGPSDRARLYERFFYFVTDVIAPNHAAFQLGASGGEDGAGIFVRRSVGHLMASERFLEDGPFMLGERFSIVDIAAVTVAATLAPLVDWAEVPRLREWYALVSARPAVIRGMRAFDLPMTHERP
jgi:GST-like protein